MKLDHVAIWVVDIERMRTFYEKYFDARSNLKYENERKRFTSYFLTFPGGGRLELMHRPDIQRIPDSQSSRELIGYAHLGVELGSRRRRPDQTTAGRRVPASRWAKTNGRRILREHGRGSRREPDCYRRMSPPLPNAKLIFLCGKMAAGKSTLARELAQREHAVLVVQDEFLDHLFPGEITDIPGFVKYSSRLKNALGPHVCALLSKGISVVLDFPGNTRAQRAWFRELFERANAEHELHFVDASDALCKNQLKERSKDLPAGAPWTTEAEFEAITVYFQPPSEEERFNVVRHERA